MSETQRDDFIIKKAVTIGVASLAAGGGLGIAGHIDTQNRADLADTANVTEAENTANPNSIEAAIAAEYDRSALIAEFTVNESNYDKLYATSDALLEVKLGDPYVANRDRLRQPLLDSAKQFGTSVQLEDTFYIVETEFDGNTENGKEYIVTNKAPLVDEIPAPIQANQESQS